MTRHFINLDEIHTNDLREIIDLAKSLKQEKNISKQHGLLAHKNLAMIFEKVSTRTRVSFEVAMNHLGGHAIAMNKNDMQLIKGESAEDTAKVLSRFVDAIMIRSQLHETITEIAKNSDVPVINGLSDHSHPCQILASILTLEEKLGSVSGKKLAWFGDSNNVLHSYIHAAKHFDYELAIAIPKKSDLKEFKICQKEIDKAQGSGAQIYVSADPKEVAKNADVLITDTWFSMGDDTEHNDALRQKKINTLGAYQVNRELMNLAKEDALFTHCLPANRGLEVSADVIDSKNSVVFDEAENRLHIQKAILLWVLEIKI